MHVLLSYACARVYIYTGTPGHGIENKRLDTGTQDRDTHWDTAMTETRCFPMPAPGTDIAIRGRAGALL